MSINNFKSIFTGIVVFGLSFTSCVSPILHKQTVKKLNVAEKAVDSLALKTETMSADISELEGQISVFSNKIKLQKRDIESKDKKNVSLQYKIDELKNINKRLYSVQDQLTQGKHVEVKKMLSQLQHVQDALQNKEDELDDKSLLIKEKNDKLYEQNQKLMELQELLDRQKNSLNILKEKLSSSLFGLAKEGLTVTQKNGKIYLSLDEKMLFEIGKYNVSPKGEAALKKLAHILSKHPDLNIVVEGHTDNISFNGSGIIKDNWDLSVKRATSVLRIMLQEKELNPVNFTASGRSEYDPINKEDTPEARQKNRRIEIIITPNLEEIQNLLSK